MRTRSDEVRNTSENGYRYHMGGERKTDGQRERQMERQNERQNNVLQNILQYFLFISLSLYLYTE